MVRDHLSTLLVGRLTRLLDLNCLEELKALEDCGYAKQNIELEDNENFHHSTVYNNQSRNKTTHHQMKIFRLLSRKDEHHHSHGLTIPKEKLEVIIKLIEYLKTDVGAEGLFRISGNRKRQLRLKNMIRRGEDIDFDAEEWHFNTHDVAGILKEFFGELEEPLLTKQLYDCYQQLAGKFKDMNSEGSKEKKVATVKTLFMLLPPLNRFLLKKLIELLSLAANDSTNKMDAYNLSVVFTPNIICTRQISGCLKFTENMEPLTDLIKFIIENADEVFQIPEDLLEEAKNIDLSEDDVNGVPMTKTFCQRINAHEYRKEAMTSTNNAIAMLYAQYLEMPDGSKKNELLAKFRESYPGTPLFIPNSVKVQMESSCSARKSFSQFSTPSSENVHENASDSVFITSRSNNLEHDSSTANSYSITNSPSVNSGHYRGSFRTRCPRSPSIKMKNCLKRIRRASQEILYPESMKKLQPDDVKPDADDDVKSLRSKSKFQSCTNFALRSLRKSLSSSTLNSRRKRISASVELIDDRKLHKVASSDGRRLHKSLDELLCNESNFLSPDVSDKGICNFGFSGDPTSCQNENSTPTIRKSLYPHVRKNSVNDESTPDNKVRTPIICKRGASLKGHQNVKRGLSLENMRRVRERKLFVALSPVSNESVSVADDKDYSNEISPIVDKTNILSFRNSARPMCDSSNISEDKHRYLSVADSPCSVERDTFGIQKGIVRANIDKHSSFIGKGNYSGQRNIWRTNSP